MARRRRTGRDVVDLVERGPDAGEEPGAEPDERRNGVQRDLAPVPGDAGPAAARSPRTGPGRGWRRAAGRTGGTARRRPPSSSLSSAWARWVRPMSSSSTNGMAARSASKVSALARNGRLYSSAACRVRRMKPAGERCHPPGRTPLRRAAPRCLRPPAAGPGPRPDGAPAPHAPRGPTAGRGRRGPRGARTAPRRSRSSSSRSRSASLVAAELLGELVELLLGHRPQLPEPPLQHAPGLLAAPRRVHQRQPGAEHRAPEQPLGGGVSPLDVDDFPALVTHASPYSPASGSSAAATSTGLSAAWCCRGAWTKRLM